MNLITVEEYCGDRSITCCVTGHRSRDLPGKGDPSCLGMRRLMSVFRLKFEEAYNDGYRRFISGMADGVDLACAVIIQEMIDSDRFPEMELVCAVPYLEQSQELKGGAAKYYYRSLVEASRYVVLVSVKENKQRYKLRNQFMVDNSSLVIGAYKYKPCGSGTQQTINMAKRAGIRTDLIHLDNNPLFYGKYSEDEPDSDTIIKGE